MVDMIKHVGRIKNTDRKCAVVFRQVVDEQGNVSEPENCLVVDVDALPDAFNQDLQKAITSSEGQNTLNLYEVLARTTGTNGNNLLRALHEAGRLQKFHTNDVVMVPHPAHKISLTELNRELSKLTGDPQVEEIATAQPVETVQINEAGTVDTAEVVGSEEGPTAQQQAEQLRFQAEHFEAEAKKFREQADALDPEGAKPKRGRPKKNAA